MEVKRIIFRCASERFVDFGKRRFGLCGYLSNSSEINPTTSGPMTTLAITSRRKVCGHQVKIWDALSLLRLLRSLPHRCRSSCLRILGGQILGAPQQLEHGGIRSSKVDHLIYGTPRRPEGNRQLEEYFQFTSSRD